MKTNKMAPFRWLLANVVNVVFKSSLGYSMLTCKLSCGLYVSSPRTRAGQPDALGENTRARAVRGSKCGSWALAQLRGLGVQEGAVCGVMPSLQLFHVTSKTHIWPELAPGATTHRPGQWSYLNRKSPKLPLPLPGTLGSREMGRLCHLSKGPRPSVVSRLWALPNLVALLGHCGQGSRLAGKKEFEPSVLWSAP